ncbi:MAG: hypothetical protein HY889_01625 [Deltaproteobacteria bacterium]|nr:hypothetical protein [Deltaproteobacteria bacterium]
MAVFNTTQQETDFKNLLREVYLRNEAQPNEWYVFTSNAGTGTSGWSFGPAQWDVRNNPSVAIPILDKMKDSNGVKLFSDTDISKLRGSENITASDLERYNAILNANQVLINAEFEQHLNNDVALIENLVSELSASGNQQTADYITSNKLAQVMLVDYNNQFKISGVDSNGTVNGANDGKMMKFLKGLQVDDYGGGKMDTGPSFDVTDIMKFLTGTKWAYNYENDGQGPRDIYRRLTNIRDTVGSFLTDAERQLINTFLGIQRLGLLGDAIHDAWLNYFNTAKTVIVTPSSHCPLIFDLDGDGVETTNVKAGYYFDHDGDGFAQQTGWAGQDDGVLFRDLNGNGLIDNGAELFGNETILTSGAKAANGFLALAELDNNADGKIDSNDTAWGELKIWQDNNNDGYTTVDEMLTLDALGIQSINTGYTTSAMVDTQGNEHRQTGSFTKTDGTTGTVSDVWFRTDNAFAMAKEWLDVPQDIAALPDLKGGGTVYDLHQAMVRDTSGALKTLVQSFIAEADPIIRGNLMEQILIKWTGSDDIDPNSRGQWIDARNLSALEKLFNNQFVDINGNTDPNTMNAILLRQAFQGVVEKNYAQLIAQTHIQNLVNMITYSWDATASDLKGDLSAVQTEIQTQINTNYDTGKQFLSEFSRILKGLNAEGITDFTNFRDYFASQSEDLAWTIDAAGKYLISGTAGNDAFNAADINSALTGGDGNDTLSGLDGNDTIYGNAGVDYLNGGNGDDLIAGGAGNDFLYGETGNDTLYGGDGNDNIDGGDGSDFLYGGAGDDYIAGGAGSDTYLFNLGDGQDTISEGDWPGIDIDVLRFGSGITSADLLIGRDMNNLYNLTVGISGTSDKITVENWYGDNAYKLERFDFANGTSLTGAEVEAMAVIRGTAGDDWIYGSPENEKFEGGLGNDYISGDGGNDTYLFQRGGGQDTITDYDTIVGNTDVVQFDVNPLDLIFSQSGNNLSLSISGSSDSLNVQNWYSGIDNQTEIFKAADGSQLLSTQVDQLVQAMASFCSSNGISWEQAIQTNPQDVQQILAQNWSQPQP